jgi:hypothetical protein
VNGPVILVRGVVARGAGCRDVCSECGYGPVVVGQACPDCRQVAAPEGVAGTLTVATSIGGHRQVVTVERSPEGGWVPVTLGLSRAL